MSTTDAVALTMQNLEGYIQVLMCLVAAGVTIMLCGIPWAFRLSLKVGRIEDGLKRQHEDLAHVKENCERLAGPPRAADERDKGRPPRRPVKLAGGRADQ